MRQYDFAMLQADAIHAGNINSVGDGVGALNRLPGIVLRRAKLRLSRMPAIAVG